MEYHDLDYQPPSDDSPVLLAPPIEQPPAWPKFVAAGVLVVAVAVTGYLVFRNRQVTAPANAPAAQRANCRRVGYRGVAIFTEQLLGEMNILAFPCFPAWSSS